MTVRAYWFNKKKNFGDQITPYLIEKITGEKPIHTTNFNRKIYFVCGSILKRKFNMKNICVWGSGFKKWNESIRQQPDIRAVRGILTRKKIVDAGYKCPEVYGDPAILLPRYYSPDIEIKYKIGLIPHFVDKKEKWLNNYKDANIIDIQSDVETVIDEILKCNKIISSSLHGYIVAVAYGKQAFWVKSNNIKDVEFKFLDYISSLYLYDVDKLMEVCPFV